MTIRKRDDSVKRGRGIDGALGETYTKDHAFNDVDFGYPGADKRERSYAGAYTENDSGVTRTDGFEHGSVSRDIYDGVMENDRPGGFDTTGKITAGVNRKQSR